MRIAHVADVQDGLAGGIERCIFNLIIAQKARGDSPVVVVPESGGLTAACDEYGIPVAIETRLEKRDRSGAAENREAIEGLCSLFTSSGTEVIHCHTPYSAARAITAGNRIEIPCVYAHHVTQRAFKWPNLKYAMIAVGKNIFEQLKKEGFPEDRLYNVPNGTQVVPRITSGSPRPSLISVGRLEHIKGFDIAILAMVELKRRHGMDCPVLNVYGGGSWEGHLKEMVSVLRLDDIVRFHGVQLGILERCPATDILIVSSRAEAGPLVALEAMSRGMPIVATRVGEIEEMIPDQRYGYITRDGSITALADGIDSMLSDVHAGRFDPDLPISRHRALYTAEKMAERVDAVYKHLITRNAPVGYSSSTSL